MHDGVGEISRLPSGVEKAPLTSFVRWWGYPPPKDAQVYVTNSPLSSGYDYARGEFKPTKWVLRWYLVDKHPRTNKKRIRCIGNTAKMAKGV